MHCPMQLKKKNLQIKPHHPCLHPNLNFSKFSLGFQYKYNSHYENSNDFLSRQYLEGMALDHHRDIAVEALQPLLIQTL